MTSDERQLRDFAFFLHCGPAFEGGVARVVLNLANYFAEEGLRIDIVVTGAMEGRPADLSLDVRIVPLGASGLLDAFLPLVRYLSDQRPTAMLSSMEHPNILAVWARVWARVPIRLSTFIARHNVEARPRSPLDPVFRKELAAEFAPQVATLPRLLGRDLSHWSAKNSAGIETG